MLKETTIENYLKAIYTLTVELGKKYAKTSEISNLLNLTPPSVTGTLKKLSEHNLVKYIPRYGVALTDKGKKIAIKMIRKHRLAEKFLVNVIGLSWEKVNDIAHKMEHIMDDEFEEKLIKILNKPKVCPHGAPIPYEDEEITYLPKKTLSEGEEGKRYKIVRVFDNNSEMLSALTSFGMRPGKEIELVKKFEDGSIMIKDMEEDREYLIPKKFSLLIIVSSSSEVRKL
ncbi:MAG: metal-dependent transcriptional regulator [Candidatus Asgardarchaeia archaeon]